MEETQVVLDNGVPETSTEHLISSGIEVLFTIFILILVVVLTKLKNKFSIDTSKFSSIMIKILTAVKPVFSKHGVIQARKRNIKSKTIDTYVSKDDIQKNMNDINDIANNEINKRS